MRRSRERPIGLWICARGGRPRRAGCRLDHRLNVQVAPCQSGPDRFGDYHYADAEAEGVPGTGTSGNAAEVVLECTHEYSTPNGRILDSAQMF
jgi:hypothetical protein